MPSVDINSLSHSAVVRVSRAAPLGDGEKFATETAFVKHYLFPNTQVDLPLPLLLFSSVHAHTQTRQGGRGSVLFLGDTGSYFLL